MTPDPGMVRPDHVQLLIDQVERNAEPAWKEAAYKAALTCCSSLIEFTADDVWAELEREHGRAFAYQRTITRSAMGPVLLRLQREGVASPTGRWRWSERRVNHRQIQVWVAL